MYYCTCSSEQKMPEGSWKCENCNNINYRYRTKCNRQNCGVEKHVESNKSPSPVVDENDQVCYVIHPVCIYFYCLILFSSLITCVFTNSMSINKMFLTRQTLPPFLSLLLSLLLSTPSVLRYIYVYLVRCQLLFSLCNN